MKNLKRFSDRRWSAILQEHALQAEGANAGAEMYLLDQHRKNLFIPSSPLKDE